MERPSHPVTLVRGLDEERPDVRVAQIDDRKTGHAVVHLADPAAAVLGEHLRVARERDRDGIAQAIFPHAHAHAVHVGDVLQRCETNVHRRREAGAAASVGAAVFVRDPAA